MFFSFLKMNCTRIPRNETWEMAFSFPGYFDAHLGLRIAPLTQLICNLSSTLPLSPPVIFKSTNPKNFFKFIFLKHNRDPSTFQSWPHVIPLLGSSWVKYYGFPLPWPLFLHLECPIFSFCQCNASRALRLAFSSTKFFPTLLTTCISHSESPTPFYNAFRHLYTILSLFQVPLSPNIYLCVP